MEMEAFEDDFGELYSGVEVHRTSVTDGIPDFARLYIEPEEDDDSDTKSEDAKLKEEFVSDKVKADTESGESTRSGGEDSEQNNGKEANDDYIGSDSEDDLNIVLNDEDCPAYPVGGVRNGAFVRGVGYDEDDGDEPAVFTEGSNIGKNGKCGDQLADGSELVSSNGLGGQSKNGVKGGYNSQFFHHKYVRRGSAFANNMKAGKSMGMMSYFSGLTKGGRNANPTAVQCGYGSYLPWNRSIFDVNIDTLEEKPWRTSGVDVTDYFNFGFDEDSWKHYCASLDKLWRASMQTGIPISESAKTRQEAMREKTDLAVSGSLHSPSLGCEVPKGRAIQVEDGMAERQPSMDVRRPRNRDSDVVIQIKVLESSDSDNSNVHESSEEGELNAGNNMNIPCSVGEHVNELSEELLEDRKNSEDSSIGERNDPIPGVSKNEHAGQVEQHSEDTAEASKGEIKVEEGIGLGTSTADLCLIESELSFGDEDLSLTSYSDSESENSVHANNEEKNSPLRRQSAKSATDLRESGPSYHKTSKKSNFHRKPSNMGYYSRNGGPIRQEQRALSHRHKPGSKLHRHYEDHDDFFSSPMYGARELSLFDREVFNHGRLKEQMQTFGSRKRRDVSYYRETEQSCQYDGEKVVDDMVHTIYTKYSFEEDRDNFRENTIRHVRKNWDERVYDFEHRTIVADNEESEQDWYHSDRGYSADVLSPLSYRDSRKLMSKHCAFPAEERDIRNRRMYEKVYFRDRNGDNDKWLNKGGLDFIDKSYRMSNSIEREMDLLENKYDQPFLHIDRELERSSGRGRHCDRPLLDLNSLWPGRMEDECQEYTYHQTSNLRHHRKLYPDSQKNYLYDTKVNGNLRGCGRYEHARDDGGSDWYCNNDATEDEDYIIHPVNESELGRRYYSPSDVLHWTEDDVIFRHQDTLPAEKTTFPIEETSWHKRVNARYESIHDEMQIDDVQLPQRKLYMPRRGSGNYIRRGSKIVCRDKHGQAKLKVRNSIDLIKGEGKFQGRSFRTRSLMCNGGLENSDQKITKKRIGTMSFNKSNMEGATKAESDHTGRKRLQNFPDKGKKEGLDAEKGQIVTKEPCLVASISTRDVSEGAALAGGSSKKRMFSNENNSNQDNNNSGYDSRKILETLAKMEKRRERFKEPITVKKEAEEGLNLNDDLTVDTGETKQHRPARKRRWGGS